MDGGTVQREAIHSWAGRSELEKTLSAGLYGPPELGRDEKAHFLGQFKERVLKLLTQKQVMEPGIYPEIVDALKDKRPSKMILNGEIPSRFTRKYEVLASAMGKDVTSTSDPDFKGDAGLVIASDEAVEVPDPAVQDRATRLGNLGVPERIIRAAGQKICDSCLKTVLSADPKEDINYHAISTADRIWGYSCPSCQHH